MWCPFRLIQGAFPVGPSLSFESIYMQRINNSIIYRCSQWKIKMHKMVILIEVETLCGKLAIRRYVCTLMINGDALGRVLTFPKVWRITKSFGVLFHRALMGFETFFKSEIVKNWIVHYIYAVNNLENENSYHLRRFKILLMNFDIFILMISL